MQVLRSRTVGSQNVELTEAARLNELQEKNENKEETLVQAGLIAVWLAGQG